MSDKLRRWRNFAGEVVAATLAVGLEAGSAWVLWSADASIHRLAAFLLLHFMACLILASAFTGLLPSQQRSSEKTTSVVVFCLCFFIPWFGMLGMTGGLLPAFWWPKRPSGASKPSTWSYLSIPALPDNSPALRRPGRLHRGVASIAGILQGASNLGQRQHGVLATLRLRDNEAIPLLRRALRDPEDDVRLLAYALLDRKEQAITARIRLHQKRLDDADPSQTISLHSAIAHDCWELIHLGLVQGEVTSYLLARARQHAEDALRLRPQNAGLQLLLGKVLARMGDFELASEALRRAEEQGIDSEIVKPHFAEIGYSQRRLRDSGKSAPGIQAPLQEFPLHGVVANWRAND